MQQRRGGPRSRSRRGIGLTVAFVASLVVAGGPLTPPAPDHLEPVSEGGAGVGAVADAPPRCDAMAAVSQWPLRQRLASLLLVSVASGDEPQARGVVTAYGVGGLFLRGREAEIVPATVLEALRASSPTGLFVAVDEEGGRVSREGAFGAPLPSAREMAASMAPAAVRQAAAERGQALRAAGIDVNLAPVLDVSSRDDGEVIGDRSFSADPDEVVTYAAAFAEGLRSAGVLPVFKHFPGHGRADGDSHDQPVTTPPVDALLDVDLVPYRRLVGSEAEGPAAVMVGHLDVPGLTEPGTPASLSTAAIDGLLRDDLAFDGLVITDDLSGMGAVTARLPPGEAAAQAVAAGADLALVHADDVPAALDALGRAVAEGGLPEAQVDRSVVRTLDAKGLDACAIDP